MPETTPVKTIREAVADGLNNLTGRTREAVVEHFAKLEADKRAAAIITGLNKLDDLENQLRRIKPAPQGFDENGEPVGAAVFSKEQVEQRKKLTEQVEKLTKALDKADDKADFGDLYNLTK